MRSPEHEEVLQDGNLAGEVRRVGETVRRPTGPWTTAVHHLLRHLEQVGFRGAPQALGIDEQAREILSSLATLCTRALSMMLILLRWRT